jgi:hypothetical protein
MVIRVDAPESVWQHNVMSGIAESWSGGWEEGTRRTEKRGDARSRWSGASLDRADDLGTISRRLAREHSRISYSMLPYDRNWQASRGLPELCVLCCDAVQTLLQR